MKKIFVPLCLVFAGCAPVSVGPPIVTDVPRGSETREVPSTVTEAKVQQDGLVVRVELEQRCTVARFDRTERTIVRERKNDAPVVDVLAALGGAFLVGSGVTGAVSPSTAQDIDTHLSRSEARGVSLGLIAAGAALLAVPVIDWSRSHGIAERRVGHVETVGKVLKENAPCSGPRKGVQIFARFPTGKDAYLGTTDDTGTLTADLDAVVGADYRLARADRAAIHTADVDVGSVALEALYELRESAAWKKLRGSSCTSSTSEADCAGEAAYVETFPEGDHVVETKHRLEDAARRRRAAAERLAFARLDLGACKNPLRNEDSDPCAPLEAFRHAYPESPHTTEVQSALLAGRAARQKMEEDDLKAAAARDALRQKELEAIENGYTPPTIVVPYAGGRRTLPAGPPR